MNEYNALERQAGLLSLQRIQTATIHTAMFMQLLAPKETGNDRLAKFYGERFPADVWKAYDGWLAQKSFENPNADPHPFVPNLYEVRAPVRLPTQARRLRRPWNPAVPGIFPVNTFRIPCSLPWFSSLPAPQGSSSSGRVRVVAFGFAAAVFAFHSADGDAPSMR